MKMDPALAPDDLVRRQIADRFQCEKCQGWYDPGHMHLRGAVWVCQDCEDQEDEDE